LSRALQIARYVVRRTIDDMISSALWTRFPPLTRSANA